MADKAKMGFAFLAVVVVAIISVGCGGSGAPDDAAEEFIPRLDEYDSDASSSLVGIVYPESAREVSADDETAVFELPDWTYEEAVAWYEEQMPAGTPYRDLSYCGESQEVIGSEILAESFISDSFSDGVELGQSRVWAGPSAYESDYEDLSYIDYAQMVVVNIGDGAVPKVQLLEEIEPLNAFPGDTEGEAYVERLISCFAADS